MTMLLFDIAIALLAVGTLGATVAAPVAAAAWAPTRSPVLPTLTYMLAAALVLLLLTDLYGGAGSPYREAVMWIAALLVQAPALASIAALNEVRRAEVIIPRWVFVVYLVPLCVVALGLGLYVAAGFLALSGPRSSLFATASGVLTIWTAAVVFVGVVAGVVVLAVSLTRKNEGEA